MLPRTFVTHALEQPGIRASSARLLTWPEFGWEVLLKGGVNKRELAKDKTAIHREVDKLVDLVADGGFILHVDHRVPPDISYDNYLYYLRTKRQYLGIPDPWADGPPDPNSL